MTGGGGRGGCAPAKGQVWHRLSDSLLRSNFFFATLLLVVLRGKYSDQMLFFQSSRYLHYKALQLERERERARELYMMMSNFHMII